MILDKTLKLLDAYAPTAVGTDVNGVYLDTTTIEDWGMGQAIEWLTQITTTVTGNANATLQFKLQGATDSAFTSPVDIALALPAAITQADFATQAVAGQTPFSIRIPRGFPYRYLRVAVVIGTATLTAGAFSSWLLNEAIQDNKNYPAGYSVK